MRQYIYLGFTSISSRKKQQGIENLVNKAKTSWFIPQQFLCKSEGKAVNIYLNLTDTTMNAVVRCVCKSNSKVLGELQSFTKYLRHFSLVIFFFVWLWICKFIFFNREYIHNLS